MAKPVPATITKTSGKWAYKLHLSVPTSLQVVAGVPIALRDIKITAGGKSYAKDWLATTSCSGGKYPYQLTTGFAPDSAGSPGGRGDLRRQHALQVAGTQAPRLRRAPGRQARALAR